MTADSELRTIGFEEEIEEGDRIETTDYFFDKIGEAVPLKPSDFLFDLQNLPAQPLAVSERFRLLFVAHASGFCVARTKDVINAAQEIKERGSASSIQELSIVDVPIGKVDILALSTDSSTLAATVGREIQFFPVNSLLAKEPKSSFSCSIESSSVKDLRWTKKMEASFVVLSRTGKLYIGALQEPLRDGMDDIDAVEWSVAGDLIAVAKKNVLSILSLELKERLHISLPFKSWVVDIKIGCIVRVDSIRWLRPDCIIVGCLQQTVHGKEQNYFVQVISCRDGDITDASSKLVMLQFSDLFSCIVDDIVPFGCGPHLFISYLDECACAVVANRKNADQHILLLGWSQENNVPALFDIERDNWLPRIELQGNGDDNLVLGLCLDKVSVYERINVKLGDEEQRELSPHCILLCLTLEGKLVMFHLASVAGPLHSAQTVSVLFDAGKNSFASKSSDSAKIFVESEQKGEQIVSPQEICDANRISTNEKVQIPMMKDLKPSEMNRSFTVAPTSGQVLRSVTTSGNSEEKPLLGTQTSKGDRKHICEANKICLSEMRHFPMKMDPKSSEMNRSLTATPDSDQVLRNVTISGNGKGKTFLGPQTSQDNLKQSISVANANRDSQFHLSGHSGKDLKTSPVEASSLVARDYSEMEKLKIFGLQSGPDQLGRKDNDFGVALPECGSHQSDLRNSAGRATLDSDQKASMRTGIARASLDANSLQGPSQGNFTLGKSIRFDFPSTKTDHRNRSVSGQLNVEWNLSKQPGNVNDMANELDKLLQGLEDAGGFMNTSNSMQSTSLGSLEEGIKVLCDRSTIWKSCIHEQLGEVEELLDDTLQVLAWKFYMEGVIKQTTDSQYWDLWNRQKLSSELELKHQNILNRSQDLVNQLSKLEKHFNSLELSRFGETDGVRLMRRTEHSKYAASRNIQLLHALHSAMSSQLAAAEQLSECLSKQMAALRLKSPPVKKDDVQKHLFETIGIPYHGDHLGCQNVREVIETPPISSLLTSYFAAGENESRKKQLGLNSQQPETARRRRDSLDQSWTNFEPSITTVKSNTMRNERHDVQRSLTVDKQHLCPSRPRVAFTSLKGQTMNSTLSEDRKEFQDIPSKTTWGSLSSSLFTRANNLSELSSEGGRSQSHMQPEEDKDNKAFSLQSTSNLSLSKDLNCKDTAGSTSERLNPEMTRVEWSQSSLTKEMKNNLSKIRPSPEEPVFEKSLPLISSSSKSTGQMKPADETVKQGGLLFASGISDTQCFATSFLSDNLAAPFHSSLPNNRTLNEVAESYERETSVLPSASSPQINSASVSSSLFSTIAAQNYSSTPVLGSLIGGRSPTSDKVHTFGLQETEASGSKISTAVATGSNLAVNSSATPAPNTPSSAQAEKPSTALQSPAFVQNPVGISGVKNVVDAKISPEDEMEEEAPETSQAVDLNLGSLGGLGMALASNQTDFRSNPFGGPVTGETSVQSPLNMTSLSGELFHPASFSFQPLQPSQQNQPVIAGHLSGGFDSENAAWSPTASSFGQPTNVGPGQQALGSVLGSFGQSRQFGAALLTNGLGGGLATTQSAGGFASATRGGFAAAAATGGGFGAVAASGFAGAASGFTGAASGGGGFGAFSSQGSGGFSMFGSGAGGGRPPPSDLFTQMRK
ncbi:hypothetical protein Ancab_024829 [Ancistrocladus abbreviatus]